MRCRAGAVFEEISFDDRYMNQFRLLCLFMLAVSGVYAQTYPVDTIIKNGDIEKRINLVFLSDGYQEHELTKYIEDVKDIVDALFKQTPYKQYKNYFNVFAISVPSEMSGATHLQTSSDVECKNVPLQEVNTVFGSAFDAGGIHRLLVPRNGGTIANVLIENFPQYDQIFVMVNTSYYGGSGGSWATSSTHQDAHEIAFHEIGHSFAGLADEYWAGPQYARERPNMTQTSNPAAVKWAPWMGISGVGIYPYEVDPTWFRPHQTCKMRILGHDYCSVCTEAIVERIHDLVNPLLGYEPQNLTLEVGNEPIEFSVSYLEPLPNSMNITWQVNGKTFATNEESIKVPVLSFNRAETKVKAIVTDATSLTRKASHTADHVYVVEWTVTNPGPITGIDIRGELWEYEANVYPNPVQDIFTLTYTLPRQSHVKAVVYDGNGRKVNTLIKASQPEAIPTNGTPLRSCQRPANTRLCFRLTGLRLYGRLFGWIKAFVQLPLVFMFSGQPAPGILFREVRPF